MRLMRKGSAIRVPDNGGKEHFEGGAMNDVTGTVDEYLLKQGERMQNVNPALRKNGRTAERDPDGKDPHSPGAKLDAGKNRLGLVLMGFASALEEVGRVGTYGANKYCSNGWKEVENAEERYTDAMFRHLKEEGVGNIMDPETNLYHAAQTAWNALARLHFVLKQHPRVQQEGA